MCHEKEISRSDFTEPGDGHICVLQQGEVNAAGSALPTGKNQESSAPSGNNQDDEPEITLPEEQELAVDYTTVKGVRAEAGAYLAVVAKGLDSGYWDAVKEGASRANRGS